MSWLHRRPAGNLFFLEESAAYVEHTLSTLLSFIYKGPREYHIVLPNRQTFPDTSEDAKENLLALVERIRTGLEYNGPLQVNVQDSKTSEWNTWYDNSEQFSAPAFPLEIEEELLNYKASLIRHLVLQLCTAKATGFPGIAGEEEWQKIELLAAWYGYSLVLLTTDEQKPEELFAADLLLGAEFHLYAMALLCRYTGADPGTMQPFLSSEAFDFVLWHYDELKNHDRLHAFSRACETAINKAPHEQILFNVPAWSKEAIAALTALIAIQPADDYYNDRGYAHQLNGRFLHAENDFTACLKINPHHAFALDNRGYCRMMMGNLQQGWEDVESSLLIDDGNSYTIRDRGIYFLLCAQPERALEDLQLALEIDPFTDHIHYWLGKAYFALSNMEEAKKQFDLSRSRPELPAPEYPM